MRKFSWCWVFHSGSDAQSVARVEATKEMIKILQESETNDSDRIVTGDESWLQHTTGSSKMFTRSAADVIPRTRQTAGAKKTMAAVFFTAKNSLCSMFFQEAAHSVSYISPITYSPI
jgi:hypothetical protein